MPGRVEVRPEKSKSVDSIKEIVSASQSIILTDYQGMSVKQMTDLRKAVRENGASYRVIKNSVSERGLPQDEKLSELLKGPIAVLFSGKEIVEPAKHLVEFAKENEKPQILGGILNGKYMDVKEIVALSKLPTRQELLAKTIQCLNGPMYGLVNVWAGVLRKFAYACNALKQSKEQEKEQGEKKGGEK